MGCSCSGSSHHGHEHAQKVSELLGSVGLKEVIEQGREAIAEGGRALGHLNRSERAKALGYGSEVSSIHADAATRANLRAQEQIQAVLGRLDHVLQDEDWGANVERVAAAFKERGGARKLQDLRADVRLRLLNDEPELSASLAGLSLAALDAAIKAGSEGDLNQVAAQLRGIMESTLKGFQSPAMGRQAIGLGIVDGAAGADGPAPIGGGADTGWCVALGACLAWAWSSLIASLIVCFAVPFCWCCFHLAALGTFMAHQFLCIVAFASLCNRPSP